MQTLLDHTMVLWLVHVCKKNNESQSVINLFWNGDDGGGFKADGDNVEVKYLSVNTPASWWVQGLRDMSLGSNLANVCD